MKRKIIHIDRDRCNGCGACAAACHEGAIEMIAGKAVLTREDHCDGLGDCLPACPTNAITFEEREALPYDEKALKHAKRKTSESPSPRTSLPLRSHLAQWPCQIKLVPPVAPYFHGADLLIAADCTAYAYASFHADFMHNRITLIACPKLDGVDYTDKLTQILLQNDIHSVEIVRMEVPCCAGLEHAVKRALQNSGRTIPCRVTTVSTDGKILE